MKRFIDLHTIMPNASISLIPHYLPLPIPFPNSTPPICRITIRPQQQRNMEVLSALDQKAQLHNREEGLPCPIISAGVECQFPNAASQREDLVVWLRGCLLGYQGGDGGLRGGFGLPEGYAPVVVGCRYWRERAVSGWFLDGGRLEVKRGGKGFGEEAWREDEPWVEFGEERQDSVAIIPAAGRPVVVSRTWQVIGSFWGLGLAMVD